MDNQAHVEVMGCAASPQMLSVSAHTLLEGFKVTHSPLWFDKYTESVLQALLEYIDEEGMAEVTQRLLLESCFLALSTISRRLRLLEEEGLLTIHIVPSHKRYHRYKLNWDHPHIKNLYSAGLRETNKCKR